MLMGRATMNVFGGACLWIVLGASPVLATTFTVTTTADAGPGSLRDAVGRARLGDTIEIAVEGTITLTSGQIFIRQSISIVGPGRSVLAISGNHASRVFEVDTTSFPSVPVNVVISGVTIRDGNWTYGGGLLNTGTLTLTDVTVSGNTATSFGGGGIYNGNSGVLTMTNSTVSGNVATIGGGIFSGGTRTKLTLADVTVTGNTATIYQGGGIYNIDNGGMTAVTDSTVAGNSAAAAGGGIFSSVGSTLMVTRSDVSWNTATVGGGISNTGALRIERSTLIGNAAFQAGVGAGGALYHAMGTASIVSSTFAGNTTDGTGGAIDTVLGSLTIVNTTIANNSSTCNFGGCSGVGGIFSNSTRLSIVHSTLSGNVSQPLSYLGGNLVSAYATATVKNSILAGPGRNCLTYFPSDLASEGHNLSDDTSCAFAFTGPGDQNGVPAGLSPSGLQANGDSVPTIALLATSPAVDAVPVDACGSVPGDPGQDERGVPRPQGGACDIGAFELILIAGTLQLTPPPLSTFTAGFVGPLPLSATLTRADDGSAIERATVAFFVDGAPVGTAPTDAVGAASLPYDPSSLEEGAHSVQATAARQNVGDVAFDAAVSAASVLQVTASPYAASVQAPIRADGTSVFSSSRNAVPVKFALAYGGATTCDLPPATISVFRLSGSTPGPVNESEYALSSDDGPSFRIDTTSCRYVYNFGTGSLGVGTYMVRILLNSVVVGRATFGVQ